MFNPDFTKLWIKTLEPEQIQMLKNELKGNNKRAPNAQILGTYVVTNFVNSDLVKVTLSILLKVKFAVEISPNKC